MEAAATYAIALLVLFAVAIVVAIARRRHAPSGAPALESRGPASLLQSALLPSAPPVVDGLRLSWSYLPATVPGAGGGDFYDAFFVDDGTLAVAIGDAAGRGLGAVVAMNAVRQALRGALLDGAHPADALRRANRVLLRSESPGIVTALVGVIDPATLQFRYAAAGHPPPLLATAETCTDLPGAAGGIALGVVPLHVAAEHVVSIPVDGLLALYTDGCVTGHDGVADTQTLAEALVEARKLAPSRPAETIGRAILAHRLSGDDATIITIAPEPQLAHLDVRLPADQTSTALARTALRRFLASTPLGERRCFDAVVAAGEAVANAIEHAYGGRPNQTFVLRARYEDQRCTILIEDSGTWDADEPPPSRGRGIAMMRELSDVLKIDSTASGTTVSLAFQMVPSLTDAALVGT
jgi:anti-sigma regulatory factor (Ser/Thr protein kinase)